MNIFHKKKNNILSLFLIFLNKKKNKLKNYINFEVKQAPFLWCIGSFGTIFYPESSSTHEGFLPISEHPVNGAPRNGS